MKLCEKHSEHISFGTLQSAISDVKLSDEVINYLVNHSAFCAQKRIFVFLIFGEFELAKHFAESEVVDFSDDEFIPSNVNTEMALYLFDKGLKKPIAQHALFRKCSL